MHLVSQAQFAKITGISGARVSVIKERLTLVHGKGKKPKIDLHGADTIQYLADREKEHGPMVYEPEPTPETHIQDTIQFKSYKPHGNQAPETQTKRELELEKLKEDIEQRKIQNQQKRGNLIEKKLVEILFGKMYQIDEDHFKQAGIDVAKRSIAIFNDHNKQKSSDVMDMIKEMGDKLKLKDIESLLNSDTDPVRLRVISMFEDIASDILKSVQREIDNFMDMLEVER